PTANSLKAVALRVHVFALAALQPGTVASTQQQDAAPAGQPWVLQSFTMHVPPAGQTAAGHEPCVAPRSQVAVASSWQVPTELPLWNIFRFRSSTVVPVMTWPLSVQPNVIVTACANGPAGPKRAMIGLFDPLPMPYALWLTAVI